MKAEIITDHENLITIRKPISAHAFDGYCAKIIQFTELNIHSVRDIEECIKMLECAKQCFLSGGKNTGFFEE